VKTLQALIVLVCLSLFIGCGAGSLGPGIGAPGGGGSSPSLVSIAVTPADADLLLGAVQQYTATGTYSDHTTQDITATVTWSSSDTNVASIDGGGLATALALGSVTISATSGSVTGSTTLTVQPPVLSSIAVRPVNKKIAQLTSQQFQAIGTYTDGSTHNLTRQVSWTSSNTAVATIAVTGRAKTLTPGTTTITATLGSISGSTPLRVSNATIVSITVTPTGRTIAPDTRLPFTASGHFSDNTNQNITSDSTWASDNHAVATVSTGGTATAIGPGTANISATFNGVSGTAPLNVSTATLVSISVTPGSAVLAPTTSINCVATGTFSDGTTQVITNVVTWTSSAPNVASVSAAGNVTAQSPGNATITAQLGTLSANCDIFVDGSRLTSIRISPKTASVAPQGVVAFTATGTFADGNTQNLTTSALWTSSPASVATVSNVPATIGQATGLNPGTAKITALFGGQAGTATLTVTGAAPTSLRVSPSATNLEHDGLTSFTALAEFSDGTTRDVTSSVTWTSSNANVAVVTPTGVATSTRLGMTTVTAAMNDVSGTAVFTVY
jgi:trimeric autotransporter adhesin